MGLVRRCLQVTSVLPALENRDWAKNLANGWMAILVKPSLWLICTVFYEYHGWAKAKRNALLSMF